jgi:hypothetical protein
MSHSRVRTFIVSALAPFAFVACASESLVVPQATPQDVRYAITLARPAAGTLYQLSVYATTLGTGAVLDAYVLDAFGAPATSGTVAFYYCSLRGNPAPSETCLTGGGHWVRYGSAGIIDTGPNQGHALLGFTESPPSGTTIGFRFRYSGQGSGIASAPSDNVADYTWP